MPQEGVQPKALAEESNIFTAYANVAQVTGSREEIMLLFGESRPGAGGQEEVRAQLKERVIMSPLAAKRLAILLERGIRDYESKYGALESEAVRTNKESSEPAAMQEPPGHAIEELQEKAEALFQLIKTLGLEVGYERSFKVSDKSLLGNRFLLGFSKKSIQRKAREKIIDICVRMGMPDPFLEDFSEKLSEANYVHFGFEEDEGTSVYKAYLEFYDKIEKEIRSRPGKSESFLLHLGYKWDPSDHRKRALTKYTWHPSLSFEQIRKRTAHILDPRKYGPPFEIAGGILDLASQKIPHQDVLYLEVTEGNNPRRSFDINMYRANLQLKELYRLLSKLCEHYSIPLDEFRNLYDRVETKTFGHVSGGISRKGADFLTIYYGVEGYRITTD